MQRILCIPASLYFSMQHKPVTTQDAKHLSGISWVEMPVDAIRVVDDPSEAKLDMN